KMERLAMTEQPEGRNEDCDSNDSLDKFTKTVLNSDSTHLSESNVDSADLSSPEKDLWYSQSFSDNQIEDQFEGVLYNTYITSCMTKLKFISCVFFNCFDNKLKADFSLAGENNPIATCYTHVQGLKCEMQIDRDSNTIKVTGVGHRLWRKTYFPKVALSLFKRYVQEADSQLGGEELINEKIEEEMHSRCFIQVQPEAAVAAATGTPMFTSTPIIQRTDHSSDHDSHNSTYSGCILSIFNMIRNMESELKEIKQHVVTSMEKKIDDLKGSLLAMLEKPSSSENTYTAVLQGNVPRHNSPTTDEGFCNSMSNSVSSESSQTNPKTFYQVQHVPGSPQTRLQNEFQAERMQHGQQVPVRITNRPSPKSTQTSSGSNNMINTSPMPEKNARPYSTSQQQSDKTLLIGDSILSSINTKGLVRGTHKHAKSGATVSDIVNDINLYDMTAFRNIIISVGGNDSARRTNSEMFEESYDKLISLIKTSNPESTVYLCKIAPRRDTDVRIINACIDNLALHWQKQDVLCISQTRDFFYGKDRIPTERYFSKDGLHLTRSGVKRLLDAINTNILIVDNYDHCVFKIAGYHRIGYYNGHAGKRQGSMQLGYRRQNYMPSSGTHVHTTDQRHSNKVCYNCHKVGHIASECLN
ncbi:MAG: hypothetical protein JAZ17_16625, partial [Candidatus Thiodiazotropha endolucinida]|nr:hypothetical protein [Candidatus Thiodiazotropha endolucinida]